jgi:hypothetical protein
MEVKEIEISPYIKSGLSHVIGVPKTSSQTYVFVPFEQDIARLNLCPEVISSRLQKDSYK